MDPREEAWPREPVAWNPAEPVAFIDFRIKPAVTPEGSQTNFLASGTWPALNGASRLIGAIRNNPKQSSELEGLAKM